MPVEHVNPVNDILSDYSFSPIDDREEVVIVDFRTCSYPSPTISEAVDRLCAF
jgi:hypothetical protein